MLVIDAYNVLHARGVLPPDLVGLDVPGLIGLIASSRYGRRDLTLVCDGGRGASSSGVRMGHARVLFSGTHQEADDVIERLIRGAGRGAALAVVSSDTRLRRAARRAKAEALDSERFLARLVADRDAPPRQQLPAFAREVPLDRYSVAHWLREFGLDADAGGSRRGDGPAAEAADPAPIATENRFGERLGIPLEAQAPAEPHTEQAARGAETGGDHGPAPEPPELDPVIRQALEEWRGRLSADDLDTGRWIDGVTPLRQDRTGRDRG